MTSLVVIILTKNESAHITDCIESARFADHIIVLDSYSDDDTVDLARDAGAEVIQHPFTDYASQRNAALDVVSGRFDWVLFVDADERVTPELAKAVRRALDENKTYAGWRTPRHNYIFGRLTRATGWYPDYQTRLLRAGRARYDPMRKVHEVVILDGELGTLDAHFTHYNYRDLAQFTAKQRKYTAYEAQIMYQEGIRPKPRNYILQPLRHFRWRFVTLKGYRDGWHGLRLSLLMAGYELRKYIILRGLWHGTNE